MSELLKELKMWRVEGKRAVLEYSNFDYWVHWDDVEEIVGKHEKQPQLNENQRLVLEWLKKEISATNGSAPILGFSAFGWRHFDATLPDNVEKAYRAMDNKQDIEVMSVYIHWALEQEEE